MTRTPLRFLIPSLVLLTMGCNRSVVTTFPDGLEPLEDENLAPDPGTASDPYPETVEVVHGETEEYGWAHSRGYVLADLTTVWEALRNPDVFVDRREADEWDAEEQEDPDYDYVILAHHVVYDLVTVEWWNTWRHGAVTTDEDSGSPTLVAIRWQKTEGSSFLELLEGSMVLEEVATDTVEIQVIEHLQAIQVDPGETAASFLTDLHADLVAESHGEPLPEFEEDEE